MNGNPFILTFGREPIKYISRLECFYEIQKNFYSETHPNQIYMITGVRGSGKTVLLSLLSKEFENNENWVVIDLNPERNMLESLASQLYNSNKVNHLFLKADFNFSFNGIGLSITNDRPAKDIEIVIQKIISHLSEKGIKILITIDDATSNENIKIFAHTYQGLLRKNYPVFLLMTGLYENITSIQNNKSLTFLSRTPKIMLNPLNLPSIKESYKQIFNFDDKIAIMMAKLTSGYAYAYQVLGYLMWEKQDKIIDESLLTQYDQYLSEFVYDKLWDNLPDKEINLLKLLCDYDNISEIISNSSFSSKDISVYRDRLIKRGILISKVRGKLSFALPRFKEYIKNKEYFE